MEQMQIFSPLMDGSPLIYCLPVLQPDKAAVKVDVFSISTSAPPFCSGTMFALCHIDGRPD
jgi:hypothetical protein